MGKFERGHHGEMKINTMRKKIQTGTWDGEPIWREQTSGERLVEALHEEKRLKTSQKKAIAVLEQVIVPYIVNEFKVNISRIDLDKYYELEDKITNIIDEN